VSCWHGFSQQAFEVLIGQLDPGDDVIIWGINPVLEALESHTSRVQRVTVRRGTGSKRLQKIIDQARRMDIPVRFEPVTALHRKAGSKQHQDVVAEISPIPLHRLSEVLESRPQLLLIMDGVEDPRNLGGVLRTADAAGVGAVLLPERRTCALTATVVKASAGGAMHVKLCRIGNVVRTLERLKQAGYCLIGLDMRGEEEMNPIRNSSPMAIVVGGEHRGLRRLVREHCDFLVRIPMYGKVSSLNLSVATALLLYATRMRPEPESSAPKRSKPVDR
jgi:23S rRNA (guanosine2251-2'-O)-methyltransferase